VDQSIENNMSTVWDYYYQWTISDTSRNVHVLT